jgi:hypothetical protein
MKKRHKSWVMLLSFLAALMLLAFIIIFINPTNFSSGNSKSVYQNQNYCSNESRNVGACYQIYQPVCGYFSQKIQCIKAPCAQTFSNSCFACMDSKVDYWVSGECQVG